MASFPAGSLVLDAGCGNGTFAWELYKRGYKVAGVDLEESGISLARKLCPDIRFENASVYDDLKTLFGNRFDVVVSLEVVEHLFDPRAFIRRLRECVRPGGTVILSTPYHGYAKNLLLALSGKLDKHFTALWDGGHVKFWSRNTLSLLLKEQGFRIDRFIGAGRLPYLWKSMIVVANCPE